MSDAMVSSIDHLLQRMGTSVAASFEKQTHLSNLDVQLVVPHAPVIPLVPLATAGGAGPSRAVKVGHAGADTSDARPKRKR
jgi:hypothetical protein